MTGLGILASRSLPPFPLSNETAEAIHTATNASDTTALNIIISPVFNPFSPTKSLKVCLPRILYFFTAAKVKSSDGLH
nr:Hypothetical protein [Raoultella ornithinolytica]